MSRALAVGTLRCARADAAAREDAAAGYARLAAETRDPVARQLVRTRAAERDTELAARQAARLQYGYILTRIGEGHALLTARAATITKDEAVQRIRAAQDELRRNAATIPRGWPG